MSEDDQFDLDKAQQELRDAVNALKRMASKSTEQAPSHERSEHDAPFCSFCGKSKSEVALLIAGPGVNICNECVALCQSVIEAHKTNGK